MQPVRRLTGNARSAQPRPDDNDPESMKMRRLVLTAFCAAAALPALAQDRPQMTPTRDVSITYRMIGGGDRPAGAPDSMTVSWQASTGRMRSDLPGMGWMVADHRAGKGFMVMEEARMVMDIPLGQATQQQGMPPNATFRRGGTERVAGLSCTVWTYQDGQSTGRSCITADGVMLRAEGTHERQTGGMEATRVDYAAQSAARFERPQGYQSMQMPQAPRR